MSRRSPAPSLPSCAHTDQARKDWQTACDAWCAEQPEYRYAYQYRQSHSDPGWDPCDACKAAWWAASPWRPELWARLDAQAAADSHPARVIRWPTLPPAPQPRDDRRAPEKMRARIAELLGKDRRKAGDGRTNAVVQRSCGPDHQGQYFTVRETNGYVALLEPTATPSEEGWGRYMAAAGPDYVELPAPFHCALKRVSLLASDAGRAVTLSYDPTFDGDALVRLTARSDNGTASETVDCVPSSWRARETGVVLAPYKVILNADYLDLACGLWPLRWYPNRPADGSRSTIEDQPQAFEPGAQGWRVVIMPMRGD